MIHTLQLGGLGAGRAGATSGGAPTYLDGLTTSPLVAWSMKKQLTSTATAALRVRRSSDNAEQDIGFSGGLLDTAALTAFVGANSGFVTKLYDQMGANHLTPVIAARQPRIVNAGVYDGYARFDAVDDCLQSSTLALSGTAVLWVFAEWEETAATGNLMVETGGNYTSGTGRFAIYNSTAQGGMVMGMNTAGVRASQFGAMGAMGIWSYAFDRATTGLAETTAWKDGASKTATGVSTNDQTGNFTDQVLNVGARNGGLSLPSTLRLRSLVIYPADVSVLRTSIEAILA